MPKFHNNLKNSPFLANFFIENSLEDHFKMLWYGE